MARPHIITVEMVFLLSLGLGGLGALLVRSRLGVLAGQHKERDGREDMGHIVEALPVLQPVSNGRR